jgi:hypothetical protein
MRTRLVVVFLMLAALACRIDVSTSYISDVHMTRDPEGTEPVGLGYAYTPGDTFYASVQLADAEGQESVRVVWTVKDVAGIEPGTVLNEETIESGNGVLIFQLAPEDTWQVGKYQIDVYLNDDHEKTAEFRVR